MSKQYDLLLRVLIIGLSPPASQPTPPFSNHPPLRARPQRRPYRLKLRYHPLPEHSRDPLAFCKLES